MPNRSAKARFSKQSWDEVKDEIRQAENEHLMEGIVAGCALVAYADGWVTDQEHDRMLGLIRGFEPITTFGIEDVIATFESVTSRFIADQKRGEAAALMAVAQLRGAACYPTLLVKTCCAIAAADGGFDAEERKVVIRICEALALDPATFDLADAP
jgi:tellurite resistance protein TerB